MPIQIIDGFKLNTNTPIDTRLVTTGTSSRNAMSYKYDGLRVYDTIQKMPFVYIDGAWKEESGGSVITTSTSGNSTVGKVNYLSKFGATGLTNSNIRELVSGATKYIGINVADNIQLLHTLHVGGTLKVDSTVTANSFVGTISGSNVAGPIDVAKLSVKTDTNNYILKCQNKTVSWVLESTSSAILDVVNNTQLSDAYLLFVNDVGNGKSIYSFKSNSLSISANLSTGQLVLGTNLQTSPAYSFKGNLNTGMYGSGTELGLSFLGSKRVYITSTAVGINIGSSNVANFTDSLISINRNLSLGTYTLSVGGATTLSGPSTISGTTTLSGSTTISGTTTLSGPTNISGATTLSGPTTTISGATTLSGSTTTISGTTTINNNFTVSTNSNTTPPNKIINTSGTGLYIKSSGELRLDTNENSQTNVITFFKGGQGSTLAHGLSTNRRGWIGFGSINSDILYIWNDTSGLINIGNTSGSVNIDGSSIDIGKNKIGTDYGSMNVWGQLKVANFIKIQSPPNYNSSSVGGNSGTSPAPAFFGRWNDSQNTPNGDSDAWIRVDKVSSTPNWGGYYLFNTNGTFTTPKLRISDIPTSSTGLAAGSVWRDGNTLKIV